MDDYDATNLNESKNEYCVRLITILTPHVIEGFRSIFDEARNVCNSNNENEKYLMTFQNFISRIPKWNSLLVEQETMRILEKSQCKYLEDLISCVHIIQLKILTCVRVGSKQKKIDIAIPKLKEFIHKVYETVARQLYKNIYLFENNIPPLQVQKNNREFELIVKDSILNAIRDNIPVDRLLKAYIEETTEEVEVEQPVAPPVSLKETTTEPSNNTVSIGTSPNLKPTENNEIAPLSLNTTSLPPPAIPSPRKTPPTTPPPPPPSASLDNADNSLKPMIKFNTEDEVLESNNEIKKIDNSDRLNDDSDEKLKILDSEPVSLDTLSVHNIDSSLKLDDSDNISLDVEVLS